MRAILLAAGMGTRLRPITLETPKSLVEVNGKPLLERQIEFLKSKGIEEIIVVVGYLAHKFDYLKEKYGVKLVINDKYDKYNNVYTMYLVKDYLRDAYVVEADIYLADNFIEENPKESCYFSAYKKDFKNEWKFYYDENLKITDIKIESGEGHIMCGVSYWTEKDGNIIVEELKKVIENRDFKELFWDNIINDNLDKISVKLRNIESTSVYEIDSIEDLKAVKEIVEVK